jgi:hypothetical protein
MPKRSKWAIQLELFNGLLNEISQEQSSVDNYLRFNRRFLIASDIASQYYCEKKVEMQYLHGKIETEAKTIGTKAHQKLTEDGVKIKKADLFKKIYGKKPTTALEMFLVAKYKDIILAGIPDAVLFNSGVPVILYEYKFSRSGVTYPSYHAQVNTYGILLENLGFDTSQLYSAIVVADPQTRGDRALRLEVKMKTQSAIQQGKVPWLISVKDARIFMNKFSRPQAEKTLDWAIEFWTKTRESQISDSQNKCAKCEYQKHCQI